MDPAPPPPKPETAIAATDAGHTPWSADAADLLTDLQADTEIGLSTQEAASRLIRFGLNRLDARPPVPLWRKLAGQFRDPLVLLLLAATAVSLGAWAAEGADSTPFEAIVIVAIVVANAVLGYVQQARAENAVAALARMSAATVRVLRDGKPLDVAAVDLVPGDVLLLSEGDAVGADARLVHTQSLQVTEAALTGESEPVLKNTGSLAVDTMLADRTNMVFNGTAVTRGNGRAVVTATGMGTEVGRIATLLDQTSGQETPLQREVALLGRVLGVTVIAISVVVMATIFLTSDISTAADAVDVLLVGVSLAVAAVPEGLPAVLSVVLALGTQRMARRQAIVKNLSSVETLGSASVICTDKTGTLTRNEMTIQTVSTPSGSVEVTGSGYRPDGQVLVSDPVLREEVLLVIGAGSLANNASVEQIDGDWVARGDPTEAAFLVAERKAGIAAARQERFERLDEVPFSSQRKLMSSVEKDREADGARLIITKGAPDVLLGRCTHQRVAGSVVPLDADSRRAILDEVDRLADLALRTLAVAYRPLPDDETSPLDEQAERELVYLGTVGIIDPPREEARQAIAEAQAAGIRVAMITGDHPRTASRIARILGIVTGDPSTETLARSGADIDAMTDEEFASVVEDCAVFARVAPEHKLRIVEALQANGAVVAMTGDGVNDGPALKTADIGVAMGITGTEVSKEAARMILADDNFRTIVAAVREGRVIFSAIRTFLRYLLSSNIGEVLTMLGGIVAAGLLGLDNTGEVVAVPLLATQILWINLLTDTAPALALAWDPPAADVMAHPPRRPDQRIIDRQMQLGVAYIGAVMAVVTLFALDMKLPGGLVEGDHDITYARTMAFTVLVLAQLFNTVNSRSDEVTAFHRLFVNPLLWLAIALSLALQVAVVHIGLLNDAFSTTPLSPSDWLLAAVLASSVLWADEVRKLLR